MNPKILATLGLVAVMLPVVQAQSTPDSPAPERGRGRAERRQRSVPNPAAEEFLAAAGAGDLDKVKAMLAADPSLATATNNDNRAALYFATTGEIVTALLDAGADVNQRDRIGVTALHEAASENRVEVVRALIDRGADLELPAEKSGSTPLHVAAAIGYVDMVELLAANGANVNASDLTGETPLMAAAENPAVAEILLAHGAELNATNSKGLTALDYADQEKRQPGIDFLKSRGAIGASTGHDLVAAAEKGELEFIRGVLARAPGTISAVDPESGQTILEAAAAFGQVATVEFLLQQKADIGARNRAGQTALHRAAQRGHVGVIPLLMAAGAEVDARAYDGETPFLSAVAWGERAAAALLLEHKANIHAINGRGQSPLHVISNPLSARSKDGAEMAALLLAAGARIDANDVDGSLPMHAAALGGAIPVAEALLAAGADVNATASKNRVAPIHFAISQSEPEMVAWLLDHGANIEAQLARGDTPLLLAADRGEIEIALLLLERGANPNAAMPNGISLVHVATLPIVEAAAARGANLNARAADGATPLCLQAFAARLDVVEFLLANGADPNAQDNNGRGAVVYADSGRTDQSGASIETEASIAEKRKIYNLLKPASVALYEAAMTGDLAVAQAALAKDPAAVGWKNPNDQSTALFIAAHQGHRAIVEALLAAHADIQARDRAEYTVMHYLMVEPARRDEAPVTVENMDARFAKSKALREQKAEIAKILIEAGADINARNQQGETPLDIAVADGEFTMSELLRSKGALGKPSSSELFQATRLAYPDRLKKLLAGDRKLANARDELGRTPVIYAANYGSGDAIKALLDVGADLSAADSNGETALHLAARKGDETMTEFLVTKKAAINARTKEGKTPLDYANLTRTDTEGNSIESESSLAPKRRVAEFLIKNGAKAGE